MLPLLVASALILLIVAAVFDWRARRRGDTDRATHGYWRDAADARREAKRAHSTRFFNRFLR